MTKWYIKELSKLCHVSVRTLQYYDKIGLLKPSERLDNGYRLYSEEDLSNLQQIIALKFFGFELSQIKTMLNQSTDIFKNCERQAQILQKKAEMLSDASNLLKRIIHSHQADRTLPWEKTLELIEVYQMTQQIENTWVKQIFNADEIKQFAEFESVSQEKRKQFKQKWEQLIETVKKHLDESPTSVTAYNLVDDCMNMINTLYGKKYAHLRTKIFEKGFGENIGLEDNALTPKVVTWLTEAMDYYWKTRIYQLLDKVDDTPSNQLLKQWNDLMDEMYGNDTSRKQALKQLALEDSHISQQAKAWLKRIS